MALTWLRYPFEETDTTIVTVLLFIGAWAALTGAVATVAALAPQVPLIPGLVLAAAQWLLLRGRVSWAVRWAVAVAASAALTAAATSLLAPVLFSAVPRASVGYYLAAVNGFLAALPLVIALGPVYGGRSFAWLVTRPVTPILVSLATSRLLLPWYASPGTRPLAVFVATACAAAVDAAVLVWVSRGAVFDRISIAGAGRAAPADRVQHGARARRLRRRRAIGGAEAPPYERRAPPYERKAWRPVP